MPRAVERSGKLAGIVNRGGDASLPARYAGWRVDEGTPGRLAARFTTVLVDNP